MNHYQRTGMIFLLALLASCMDESRDNCPREHRLVLGVRDKDYDNITSIPELPRKGNTLPFQSYVPDFFYNLGELDHARNTVHVPTARITHRHAVHEISLSDYPAGRYHFLAIGNTNGDTAGDALLPAYTLHEGTSEGQDLYIARDTLEFPARSSPDTLLFSRVKGALLLSLENTPDSVGHVDVRVENVSRHVDRDARYSGTSTVQKSFSTSSAPPYLTLLAPTPGSGHSSLHVDCYATGRSVPFLSIPATSLTIQRNHVARVKLNFLPDGVEIWIVVNDTWQQINQLEIETF